MTPTDPYSATDFELGTDASGRRLSLAPMTPAAAAELAPEVAAIGPWAHYRFPAEAMLAGFLRTGDGAVRYQVLDETTPAGAVVIRSPWLVGPYLQILALLPRLQGRGCGTLILDWYERRAALAKQRFVWLCVSGFNVNAQRFYARHGYELVSHIPDLVRDGDDELLMRKRVPVSA